MRVDNYELPLEPFSVILKLREELAKKKVYRFSNIYMRPGNLMFNCPMHKNGQERRPSCSLVLQDYPTIKEGTVKCFSCGYSASLFEMISELFGKRDFGEYGKEWIVKTFNIDISESKYIIIQKLPNRSEMESKRINNTTYITEDELKKYRYYHPYMYERKLTDEIIEEYDIGYDSNYVSKNRHYECITMPVKNQSGKVEAIIRRSIKSKRFFIPQDWNKCVYGLYEVNKNPYSGPIYITESIFNCLTLRQWKYNAVALIGLGTDSQAEELRRTRNNFILAFDGDEAGYYGALKFGKKLKKSTIVHRLQLPENKDVNDLSLQEFNNLLEYYL